MVTIRSDSASGLVRDPRPSDVKQYSSALVYGIYKDAPLLSALSAESEECTPAAWKRHRAAKPLPNYNRPLLLGQTAVARSES